MKSRVLILISALIATIAVSVSYNFAAVTRGRDLVTTPRQRNIDAAKALLLAMPLADRVQVVGDCLPQVCVSHCPPNSPYYPGYSPYANIGYCHTIPGNPYNPGTPYYPGSPYHPGIPFHPGSPYNPGTPTNPYGSGY